MELRSGDPYFLLKNGLYKDFDILQSDHTTDVLVLGGGISGALTAYQLVKNGVSCTVVDKRKTGLGSTSASTSLLQYEIDVPLHQLSKQIGKENACKAYMFCSESIDMLFEISGEIGFKEFEYCNSVYFSHTAGKNTFLKKEFESRREAGFAVELLEEEEIKSRYRLRSSAAILSKKAAKMDVYLFTYLLHRYNLSKGSHLFENTCIEKITEQKDGVELLTDKGHRIKAKKIVYASGYEVMEQINKSIVDLKSTYAIVTERIRGLPEFFSETLFWNTSDPYLYVREDEGRLIIGGRDDKTLNTPKSILLLEKKSTELLTDFEKVFPEIKVRSQFAWSGTFGSTKDGLPYIGTYSKKPNSYFALGFGGNGITFSALAADLIAKSIKGNANCVPEMFRFNR